MRERTVGWAALSTLVLTSGWLVLLIIDQSRAGPLDTYAQALAHVRRLDAVYYAIYVCAGMLTATTAMLMAGLYVLLRDAAPVAASMGLVFVPAYAAINLFVYFAQVAVVPALLTGQPAVTSQAMDAVLQQMLHLAPGSAAAFANALAYAVLALPSLLFGWMLWRRTCGGVWLRTAGVLLAASGALGLAGFLALVVDVPLVDWGLVAGGAVFWLALFPLSAVLLRTS